MSITTRSFILFSLGFAAFVAMLTSVGCGTGEKPRQRARSVQVVTKNYPDVLRGTVVAETTMRGIQPVIVSGYGVVVGLNNTGGGQVPERISLQIEQEMGKRGISRTSNALQGTAYESMTPRQMLRDPSVSIVLVQAAIPPGLPDGESFDVYVRTLSGSGTTSLEGGILWTTDLRLGPPTALGGTKTRIIASARGPVFINPFQDPASDLSTITQTTGRIFDGGSITHELELTLMLDNPSHVRARSIVSAINSRFPPGPGDQGQTARGRDDRFISIRVPNAFRSEMQSFVNLVRYLQIDQTAPKRHAKRYTQALIDQPWLAEELAWCLQGLGPVSKGFLRELYDHSELIPRMAALRAGAGLGDPETAEPLYQLAVSGPAYLRSVAVEFLTDLPAGPKVDQWLLDLVNDNDLEVRVAAYEALATRAERVQLNRMIRAQLSAGQGSSTSLHAMRLAAESRLTGNTLQRVQRSLVTGKFLLDIVPSSRPTVYITQQGVPKIVIFGSDIALKRPTLASAWSDRLMLDLPSESGTKARIWYKDYRTGKVIIDQVNPRLTDLIAFLSHTPTPEDPRTGLGLSYAEVVGALYELEKAGAIPAAFATEQDRLMAQLAKASKPVETRVRPETETDRDDRPLYEQLEDYQLPEVTDEQKRKSRIVPLGGNTQNNP